MFWYKLLISLCKLYEGPFFTVQLSPPYMTTGKTIVLTRRTSVDKVMSLLLNMLPRLVVTFLPRSKHLLISSNYTPIKFNLKKLTLLKEFYPWVLVQPEDLCLFVCLFFNFRLYHVACRILVPWSGIKPAPLQHKHTVPTIGPPRKSQVWGF